MSAPAPTVTKAEISSVNDSSLRPLQRSTRSLKCPGAGSPRLGEICGIDGLRFRRVTGFPCGWFYFVAPDHVDVVRLLADAQDLPSLLADTEHP